jgi:sensor histidine kinase YesM
LKYPFDQKCRNDDGINTMNRVVYEYFFLLSTPVAVMTRYFALNKITLFIKTNKIQIMLLIISCMALVNILSLFNTLESRALFGMSLLAFNYVVFLALVMGQFIVHYQSQNQDQTAKRWLPPVVSTISGKIIHYKYAISFMLVFIMLIVFQETHHIRLVNNLSIAFAYGLLFFHIFLFAKERLQRTNQELNLKSQKNYIIYAVTIWFFFSIAKTMDGSDPFGTQFQYFVLCWLMFAHLVFSWLFGQWKLVKQLKNERINTELMHLKSQVNPHFFFNTLNNLYGLALEKSDQTPGLILKLSELMRYTIYQGSKERVSIDEEINYLNNYIDLQKIRFQKHVEIKFDTDISAPDVRVSPLLFINLLENAFKHGVEKLTSDAYVHLLLSVNNQCLYFKIANNFDPSEQNESKGIGIDNLDKRLRLSYPGRYELKQQIDQHTYTAELSIQLNAEET